MAQRQSGYERVKNDFYPTPEWVTEALLFCSPRFEHPRSWYVWENADGSSAISNRLKKHIDMKRVWGTDITGSPSVDFLSPGVRLPDRRINAIITNPPFQKKICEAFIRKSLELMRPQNGVVAMLLRIDYDSAVTRGDIFDECPAWSHKLILTKRIKWFDHGSPHGPSENHAWYVWDWSHSGPSFNVYGH